jgi:hypothetical protein
MMQGTLGLLYTSSGTLLVRNGAKTMSAGWVFAISLISELFLISKT